MKHLDTALGGFAVKTPFRSQTCFVASAISLPTPLSGTKPPHGTEAQHKGKRKLLSSSISLVILGGQFSTELVSRIQNTFSYVERE